MSKFKTFAKKTIALLLAVVTTACYIPLQASFAGANAATMLGSPKVIVARSSGGTQAQIPSGIAGLATGPKSVYRVKHDGKVQWVYCIDPQNADQAGGASLSSATLETSLFWMNLKEYQQNGVRKAIIYGYNSSLGYRSSSVPGDAYDSDSSDLPTELRGKVNLSEYWLATQYIIWEYTHGYRTSTSVDKLSNKAFYNQVHNGNACDKKVGIAYDYIISKILKDDGKFSFASTTESKAKSRVKTMKASSTGTYTNVQTDDSKMDIFFSNGKKTITAYDANKKKVTFKVSRNGEKYTFTASANFEGTITLGLSKMSNADDSVTANVIYYGNGRQNMAEISAGSDLYVSFKTSDSYGYVVIDKKYEAEDGTLKPEEEASFNIWSADYPTFEECPDNLKDTLTTTTHGKSDVSKKLPTGEYKIIQISAPADVKPGAWLKRTTFTIEESTVAKPHMFEHTDKITPEEKHDLPKFSLDLAKLDSTGGNDKTGMDTGRGDAALDAEITVEVTPDKGAGFSEVLNLDVNGKLAEPYVFSPWTEENLTKTETTYQDDKGNTHTLVTYDASATVTVTESGVPAGRFDEVTGGTGTGVRTHKLTYHSEILDGGEPTYTITYDGKTSNTLDTKPLELDKDTFVNPVYRGNLQLIKTKSDQDPFTETGSGVTGSAGSSSNTGSGSSTVSPGKYATDALFTLRLTNSGYEGNPYVNYVKVEKGEEGYDPYANVYRVTTDGSGQFADAEHPLEVSDYGQIKVLDLPYGTYTIDEIKADANGYVLESANIAVTYDGQLISTTIGNTAKKNRVKVTKVNSETGKTVSMEGTKFRIKYLGNPDLTDPTSATNAGRYLPNGSDANDGSNFVFECDENGYIVLPYQLEYGNYQLEEITVPDGYYVGSYDKDGNGSSVDMDKTFDETVEIFDDAGNPVKDFEAAGIIFNAYKFSITEQDRHIDGTDYITFYLEIEMKNNPTKGKIQISKSGEIFAGWAKTVDGSSSLYEAVFKPGSLPDVRFLIYAADDVVQVDGVIPIKSFDADGNQVALDLISREPSSADNIKEVYEKTLSSGEKITQTRGKNKSAQNTTVTEYIAKAVGGAGYKDTFEKTENGLTYKYTVEYAMSYVKGGMSYTDVHVKKETLSDTYTASIKTTEPQLLTGIEEIDLFNIVSPNKNIVKTNSPIVDEYATDNIDAVAVKQSEALKDTDDPEAEENKDKVQIPEMPEGYTITGNTEIFVASKTGDDGITLYMTCIKEADGTLCWVNSDEHGTFYKSYVQEYDLSLIQHYEEANGFTFSWDDIKIETGVNQETQVATTKIKDLGTPIIEKSAVYTESKEDGNTILTASPEKVIPVYFATNDGIKTQMFFSGGLTCANITVTQSQLKEFKTTLPSITYGSDIINWMQDLGPANNNYEYLVDANNYVKVTRHEASPEVAEVYYTIDIVTNSTSAGSGFVVTYPDTTTMTPLVVTEDSGKAGKLIFTSLDETTMYPMGSPVEVITTGADGMATTSNLPLGTYYVFEAESAAGYVNSGKWQKFELKYEDQYTPLIWAEGTFDNDAVSLKIDLKKLGETALGSGEYAPLAGAVFGVYTAEDITAESAADGAIATAPMDSLVGTFITNANGTGTLTAKLPQGKYYVKEISAPSGFKLNATKFYFDAVDVLTSDRIELAYKDSGISGTVTADGNGNAIVSLKTLAQTPAISMTVNGKTYAMDQDAADDVVTNTVLTGQTTSKITIKNGETVKIELAGGSILEVTAAGNGYTASFSGNMPTTLTGDGTNIIRSDVDGKTVMTYEPKVTVTNYSAEAEYRYVEIKEPTEEQKAKITELVLTAPDRASTLTARLPYDHAQMEVTVAGTISSLTIDGADVAATNNFTLQRGSGAIINLANGITLTASISADGHVILNVAGAQGGLANASTFTIDAAGELPENATFTETVAKTYARNDTSAGVLNITVDSVKNERVPYTPVNPGTPVTPIVPSIHTTALDSSTKDHVSSADGSVTIIDTVTYQNLTVGKTYVMQGTLMDKATGKPILDKDGKEITAEKTFTPSKSSGSVEMTFKFDGSNLAGKTTVVFEKVYEMVDTDKDGKPDTPADKETAKHEDLKDDGQTIYFPEIKTNATDSATGDHIANADKKATITDEVSYTNLIPGKEYTVKGTLMDKATGKALLVDGKKVTAEKTFTPEKANGSVTLIFALDASSLAGKTTVVFEKIYLCDKVVGVHEDLTDKNQTVRFPEVKTSASSTKEGVITDVVKYTNLIPGKEYTVSGVLMDKASGKPVLDKEDKEITAEKTFTPSKSSGTVKLNFYFDKEDVAGKTTVVFETLTLNGEIVGTHKDINDKDQTVRFDKEGTVELIPPGGEIYEDGNVGLTPKTGDTQMLWLYAIILMLALAGLIAVESRKEKK